MVEVSRKEQKLCVGPKDVELELLLWLGADYFVILVV